jgi:hypothetical protein
VSAAPGPLAQRVTEYRPTAGKNLALEYFHWHLLSGENAELVAPALLRLAGLIDDKITPVCALLKKAP